MKKLISFLLAGLITIWLAGCEDSGTKTNQVVETPSQSHQASEPVLAESQQPDISQSALQDYQSILYVCDENFGTIQYPMIAFIFSNCLLHSSICTSAWLC